MYFFLNPYIIISTPLQKARWVFPLLRKARCPLYICQQALFWKQRISLFTSNENILQIHQIKCPNIVNNCPLLTKHHEER